MPGVLRLLARRYESPQERGRVFERLMQQAFQRHPDVYGPRRFKRVWRWMGEAFSSRLLAVTAPVNLQARQIILKARPRCEVLYGSDLDSWDVNWEECLDDPSRMRFAPTPRHIPKPYQADAVDSVAAGLAEHDRGPSGAAVRHRQVGGVAVDR